MSQSDQRKYLIWSPSEATGIILDEKKIKKLKNKTDGCYICRSTENEDLFLHDVSSEDSVRLFRVFDIPDLYSSWALEWSLDPAFLFLYFFFNPCVKYHWWGLIFHRAVFFLCQSTKGHGGRNTQTGGALLCLSSVPADVCAQEQLRRCHPASVPGFIRPPAAKGAGYSWRGLSASQSLCLDWHRRRWTSTATVQTASSASTTPIKSSSCMQSKQQVGRGNTLCCPFVTGNKSGRIRLEERCWAQF